MKIIQNEFNARDRYQSLIIHDLRTPSQSTNFAAQTATENTKYIIDKYSEKLIQLEQKL